MVDIRSALLVVLDHVDYTDQACTPTEMVGAVLPREVITRARDALRAKPGGVIDADVLAPFLEACAKTEAAQAVVYDEYNALKSHERTQGAGAFLPRMKSVDVAFGNACQNLYTAISVQLETNKGRG